MGVELKSGGVRSDGQRRNRACQKIARTRHPRTKRLVRVLVGEVPMAMLVFFTKSMIVCELIIQLEYTKTIVLSTGIKNKKTKV